MTAYSCGTDLFRAVFTVEKTSHKLTMGKSCPVVAPSVLIGTSSKSQVCRTGIKSRIILDLDRVVAFTSELLALE